MIYLDHHATTPVDPRVVDAMLPYFTRRFGNPSSISHQWGWEATEAVEEARQEVATLINATPDEIVFTSGATESDNLALTGLCETIDGKRDELLTTPVEHQAVLETARAMHCRGYRVSYLRVDSHGRVHPDQVQDLLTERTALVSVIMANNEVGTVNPISAIGEICRAAGVILHTDAAQALGRLEIDVRALKVDMMSLSSHKIYGPKGIGALYLRCGSPRPAPLLHGGGQEHGIRSGTLNVPGIVGFGMACKLARRGMPHEPRKIAQLRDQFHAKIMEALTGVTLNGHPTCRLPGNLHLSFQGAEGEALLQSLPQIAASTGSACASESHQPSHVLLAMGIGAERARTSIRFGLGRSTTAEEINTAVHLVSAAVSRLRALGVTASAGSHSL